MTSDELTTLVQEELGGLTDYITGGNDYTNAISKAERETGFAMPVSSDFQVLWMTERTKRHLLNGLRLPAAYGFQYKQIHLEHRFQNLDKIVKQMDNDFREALDENVSEFAGAEAYEMFGHKVDAGFATNVHGSDYTYESDQKVVVTPGEDSSEY